MSESRSERGRAEEGAQERQQRAWREAFGGLSEEHPVWRSLNEVLEEEVRRAMTTCALPARSGEERAYDAGALGWALAVRARLRRLWKEGKGNL